MTRAERLILIRRTHRERIYQPIKYRTATEPRVDSATYDPVYRLHQSFRLTASPVTSLGARVPARSSGYTVR